MELAELYSALQAIDGYRARARAAASLMHGLGFKTADLERTVAAVLGRMAGAAGPWPVRSDRAPTCCLLDEPTNHLDLDAILWLEEWLRPRSPGTLLMISHDREFLDAIIDRVLHIENKRRACVYAGNYSEFEQKRDRGTLAAARRCRLRQMKTRRRDHRIRQSIPRRAQPSRGRRRVA